MPHFEPALIWDLQKAGNASNQALFDEEKLYFYELTADGDDDQSHELFAAHGFSSLLNVDSNNNSSHDAIAFEKSETICSNRRQRASAKGLSKDLVCDQCGKRFANKNNIRLHMYHHRRYFEIECRACGRKYKSLQSMRYHLRQHFEVYTCGSCGREFEHKKLLKAHIAAIHDQELRVKCSYCTRLFARNDIRDTHERNVHKNGNVGSQFRCKDCGEMYNYRKELSDHIITSHFQGTIHSCEECGRKFKKKSLLDLHRNVHAKRMKKFSCTVCAQAFSFKGGLDRHLKLKRCKGSASLRESLSKEQMAETAKEQLLEISVIPSPVIANLQVAMICDEFKMEELFDDNEDAVFDNIRNSLFEDLPTSDMANMESLELIPFACDICEANLASRVDLLQHMKNHLNHRQFTGSGGSGSQRQFMCPEENCNYRTNSPKFLKTHLKTHNITRPHVCDNCGKRFKRKCDLANHQRTVHASVKTYIECDKCKKMILSTSLKSHLINKHTDKANFKPYECKICGKRERYEKALQRHFNSAHNPQSRGVSYACSQCTSTFLRLRDLKAHSLEHFTDTLSVCAACGAKFKTKSGLKTHARVHEATRLPCSKCQLTFKTKSGLNKHLRKHQ